MTEILISFSLVLLTVFLFVDSIAIGLASILQKPCNWLLRKVGVQQPSKVSDNINDPVKALIGQQATVVDQFNGTSGRVKAGHTEWKAQTAYPHDSLKKGDVVLVRGEKEGVLFVSL